MINVGVGVWGANWDIQIRARETSEQRDPATCYSHAKVKACLSVTCLGHRDPETEVAGKKYKPVIPAWPSSEAPPEDPEARGKAGHCLTMDTCVDAYCIKYLE